MLGEQHLNLDYASTLSGLILHMSLLALTVDTENLLPFCVPRTHSAAVLMLPVIGLAHRGKGFKYPSTCPHKQCW